MKNLLLFLLIAGPSFGFIPREYVPPVMLESSTLDESMDEDKALFRFEITGIMDDQQNRKIRYSIDDKKATAKLINNSFFEVETTPGTHEFKFYYDLDHNEVSAKLAIKAQHVDVYRVQFENADYPYVVEKPVIYLYPEKETNVTVHVDPVGEFLFTYPEYGDRWECIAFPNGDIKVGDHTYNYLFWEAEYPPLEDHDNPEGFVVRKEEVIPFLEKKLTAAGLTSKEQADFITYWGPRMQQNEVNFVHFDFNSVCDRYAKLSITPQPDEIYRIYVVFRPISGNPYVEPQRIPRMNRHGFTVVEWGGMEIKPKR